MKKYKYVVFSPYFGKLPVNFNLWLNSCSFNKDFKFIVFTDDKKNLTIPDNVQIIYLSFEDFVNRIQQKFDFKIGLSSPYKLCDFKPAYGYIFDELLEGCTYWGYCDIDLIFGDLKKFMPDEEYDKISFLGHFCLYKNENELKKIFMKSPDCSLSYIDIFSCNQHFGADEIGAYGINNILKVNNYRIYNYSLSVADVDCRCENMNIITFENGKFKRDNKNVIFIFDNGQVFSVDKDLNKIEYAYVHFQKRIMRNNVKNINHFIINYNSFIDYFEIDKNSFKILNKKQIIDLRRIKFAYRAILRRIKRMRLINKIKKSN